MDVDFEFLPVAEELVNEFATPVTYIRNLGTAMTRARARSRRIQNSIQSTPESFSPEDLNKEASVKPES